MLLYDYILLCGILSNPMVVWLITYTFVQSVDGVCNYPFLDIIILIIYYMYLCGLIFAYLLMCVFDLGLVNFWPIRVF